MAPTERQRQFLLRYGLDVPETKEQATDVIGRFIADDRWRTRRRSVWPSDDNAAMEMLYADYHYGN